MGIHSLCSGLIFEKEKNLIQPIGQMCMEIIDLYVIEVQMSLLDLI